MTTFDLQFDENETLTIEEAIIQALGFASKGVFTSEEVTDCANKLGVFITHCLYEELASRDEGVFLIRVTKEGVGEMKVHCTPEEAEQILTSALEMLRAEVAQRAEGTDG